jgi:hypothetical protein
LIHGHSGSSPAQQAVEGAVELMPEAGFGLANVIERAGVIGSIAVGYPVANVVIEYLEVRISLAASEFAFDAGDLRIGHANGAPAGRGQFIDPGWRNG